jgi:dephospho-CoA kinase
MFIFVKILNMIKVGLSGNRYSGKDRVCSLFNQIGVPIFNADVILKFILSCNYEVLGEIKEKFGESVFKNGSLSLKEISNQKIFKDILDIVEPHLMVAYDRFINKNKKSLYTIFHSSILFERGWNAKMDKNISVFSPLHDRVQRCRAITQRKVSTIHDLAKSEIKDLDKNNKSDFVVHNYEAGLDPLDTVNDIDKAILNEIIERDKELDKNKKSKVTTVGGNKNFIRINL